MTLVPLPAPAALLASAVLGLLIVSCIDTEPKPDPNATPCTRQHLCHGEACGAPCESAEDCAEGFECLDADLAADAPGFCTTTCEAQGPWCGCDWYCGPRSGVETRFYCLNEAPCTADDACAADGEFCSDLRPVCDASGCRRQPFCGAALCDTDQPGCADGTEPCTDNASCYTGLCMGYDPPRCLAHCGNEEDCDQGAQCLPATVALQDGTLPVVMNLCILLGQPCERDEDCAAGRICGIEVSLTPTCVTALCERGAVGCNDSGETCGDRDACYNRLCLGSGNEFVCHEFCREDHHEDCDVEGQVCRQVKTLAGGLFACVTAGLPCKRSEDCTGPDEACGIRSTLDPECRAQAGDPSRRVYSGEQCNLTDQICFNNLCLGQMVGDEFRGTCYELCDPEKEGSEPTCPESQNCRVKQIKTAEDEIIPLDVCTVY